jgi:hypothetical protein
MVSSSMSGLAALIAILLTEVIFVDNCRGTPAVIAGVAAYHTARAMNHNICRGAHGLGRHLHSKAHLRLDFQRPRQSESHARGGDVLSHGGNFAAGGKEPKRDLERKTDGISQLNWRIRFCLC